MESGDCNKCGMIFISLDRTTALGKLTLHCTLCELEFNDFELYKIHLFVHYPQIEFEHKNERCVKKHNISKGADDDLFEGTNKIMNFLQMESNKHKNLGYFDIEEFAEEADTIEENMQKQSKTIYLKKTISLKRCPHCERKFQLSSSFNRHLKRHRKNGAYIGGLYICNLCNARFELKSSLKLHTSSEHNHKIQNKLQTRLETKNDDKKITITSRNKRTNPISLKNAPTPLPSNSNNLFANNSNLEPIELNCTICSKKFADQSRYNAHMNRHKPCEYQCTTCSKAFKTAGELQTHTRFHTGERPYLCSCCGDTFATVSKLINHTRRHHTFQRTKECPVCKKKFYGSGELKVHLQSTHSNERPYKCKLCPSTFNRQFSLRTHMKSHENKREYKCNLCTASFNQKCNLTAHKKKAHCLVTDHNKRD